MPLLRAFAFGPYDWTQSMATNVLCRLALDGIEAEATACCTKLVTSMSCRRRCEAARWRSVISTAFIAVIRR